MEVIFNILQSFGITFIVSAVITWVPLVFKPVRKSDPKWITSLYLTAVTIGFSAGFAFIQQRIWPGFPPLDSGHWFVYFMLPSWILALWQIWRSPGYLALGLNRIILIGSMTHLVFTPLRNETWTLKHSLLLSILIAGIFVLYTSLLEHLSTESTGKLYPILFTLVSVASAVLFIFGSSAVLHQQTLLITITLLIPLPLSFWKKDLNVSQGLIGLVSFLLLAHWLNAWLFASLDKWTVLALLTPFSVLLLKIPGISKRSQYLQTFVVWGFGLLYLGTIVLTVYLNQPSKAFPY